MGPDGGYRGWVAEVKRGGFESVRIVIEEGQAFIRPGREQASDQTVGVPVVDVEVAVGDLACDGADATLLLQDRLVVLVGDSVELPQAFGARGWVFHTSQPGYL